MAVDISEKASDFPSPEYIGTRSRFLRVRSHLERNHLGNVIGAEYFEEAAALLERMAETITTLTDTEAKLAEAEKLNEAMAANQCLVAGGIVGDEGGTPYCTVKAQLSSAEARGLERAVEHLTGYGAVDGERKGMTLAIRLLRELITSPMPSQRERELALIRFAVRQVYAGAVHPKIIAAYLDAFNTQSKET